MKTDSLATIDRQRLEAKLAEEVERFKREHPRSFELSESARKCLLAGVPMNGWFDDTGFIPAVCDGRQSRGVLLTSFHNKALMSPATSEADIDKHTEVFRDSVQALL